MATPSNTTQRFNSTDRIGEAVLDLCFLKKIGWIIRSINKSDMGIDANVEQVRNGNPTGKYISIQLKTGLGNVYETENEYIFYFNQIHYEYWLSSSIPVIIVLCDPDEEVIFWELIKKKNIKSTNKNYKIHIRKNHILNENSIEELESIIDTYQANFQLPNDDDLENIDIVEYAEDLFSTCSEALHTCSAAFDQLHKKYQRNEKLLLEILNEKQQNGFVVSKKEVNRQLKTYTKLIENAINICRCQITVQIPIITKTHIEAIRLLENIIQKHKQNITNDIAYAIKMILDRNIKSIFELADCVSEAANLYEASGEYSENLKRTYKSFANILADYNSWLLEIIEYIKPLIQKIELLL